MSPYDRVFRVFLDERAKRFYESADAVTQAKLDRVFDLLEDNPHVDGDRKFYYTRYQPAGFIAYGDDDFHILYQLDSIDLPNLRHWRILIFTIEEALPLDFESDR